MQRRQFLMVAAAALAGPHIPWSPRPSAAEEAVKLEDIVNAWQRFVPAGAQLDLSTDPIERPDAQWKAELSEEAYHVLFEEGTERPFTSPLNEEKRPGLFVCAACALPLFTSAMKYDSGTGWPSFFTSIPGHLGTKRDFKLILPRTEYHCVRCGGHQGHVFKDGPPPTGQRFCNNGVALRFLPRET